jgi:hypothetical protein
MMINHRWDRGTHRKVMLVGTVFCAAFVAVSFFLRPQPETSFVLKKADKIVRTVGSPPPAN